MPESQELADLRKARQSLTETGGLLRTLIDHAPEAIVLMDADTGRFVDWNPNALRLLGLDEKQITQVGPFELSPPTQPDGQDSQEAGRRWIARALAGENPVFEWVHRDTRGREFPCEVRLVRLPVAGRNLIRGSVTDITERRRAEHALRQAQSELEDRVRRRTAELARSEERWRSVVATAPDLILIINADGTIRYINRTTQGFQLANVIGRPAVDFLSPDCRPAFAAALQRVLDTGEVYRVEVAAEGADGSLEWYASRLGPFYENNRVVGVTSIATNVTQHKQVQEATRRLAGIVQAADDAIISATTDGIITSWNEGAQRLLGYRSEEAIGQSVLTLQPHDVSLQPAELLHAFQRGEKLINVETQRLHKTGRRVPVSLTISPLKKDEDTIDGFCAILRDITERKNAEKTIQSEQKLLRRLLEIQERERQMLAHDIHDGFVQYIVGAHMILQSGERQLESQNVAIPESLTTVGDLLQRAIAEGRRLIGELRPMVIDERGFLEAVRHLIADAKHHFGLEVALTARVDFDRLDPKLEGAMFRIVQEALNNIRRHGQTDRAEVRVVQQDGTVRIEVQDYGVGFEPEAVPAERFGLRGIKERARLFGGRAWITSHPGTGTLVVAEMPCIPQSGSG